MAPTLRPSAPSMKRVADALMIPLKMVMRDVLRQGSAEVSFLVLCDVWSAADCQTALPRGTVRDNVSGLLVKRSSLRATMESGAGPSSLNSRSSRRPFRTAGFRTRQLNVFDHRDLTRDVGSVSVAR